MVKIIETERLYLREFELTDAEHLFLLNKDEDVLQFTGDLPFKDIDAAQDFVKGYDHYKKYGFGRWALLRSGDNQFLGWCGLKYTQSLDEYDIGFRLFAKYWGQGYATEAALACLDYGFNKLQLREIVGRAMKANPASIKVLEKIGMTYYKDFDFEGQEGVKYMLGKE